MITAVVLSRFGTPALERFRDEIIIPRAALAFTVVTIDNANGANGQPDNWYQLFNICTWIADAFITVTFAGELYSINISEEQLLLQNLRERTFLSAFLEYHGAAPEVSRKYARLFDARLFVRGTGAPAKVKKRDYGLQLAINAVRLSPADMDEVVTQFFKRTAAEVNARQAEFLGANISSMMLRNRVREFICRDEIVKSCLTVHSGSLPAFFPTQLDKDAELERFARGLLHDPRLLATNAQPPITPAGRAIHGQLNYFTPWAFILRAQTTLHDIIPVQSKLISYAVLIFAVLGSIVIWPIWWMHIRLVSSRFNRTT
jgi:hypothetical protein